ncbi:MAG: ornithine--oxo-acid transaminase [Candidatus Eremiobacteraeota bacterium]|nr:ornithine--oxo-acid transaminase [Candidatus Eremiobacteraeota bacterium]
MQTATHQAQQLIQLEEKYGAHNYDPLNVVIERAEGVWLYDVDGNRYLDCISAYSAVNQGHAHPRIVAALEEQAEKVSLVSRAVRNARLGGYLEKLTRLCGYDMALPTNTGVEAVETAIKLARRWAYDVKGIAEDAAEIIVFENNFHGRTIAAISASSEPKYRRGFGPLTPGFSLARYGDIAALQSAITPNTAAILIEPIQGEGGVLVPPDGYLSGARELCSRNNVLFIADEIQTGLGRTGDLFACDYEDVKPDILIIGKALGGGIYPVSATLASRDLMLLFRPGEHGSTFGGNPLACAVGEAAIDVIVEEQLPQRSRESGAFLRDQLRKLPNIKEVRGRGLLIGLELDGSARTVAEALLAKSIVAKDTHRHVLRIAPPLIIEQPQLESLVTALKEVL